MVRTFVAGDIAGNKNVERKKLREIHSLVLRVGDCFRISKYRTSSFCN